MEATDVLIVDDHPLFGEALAARLRAEPDLRVLPVAVDVRRAQMLLATEHPDVVVLDLMLGTESGLDVLEYVQAKHADTKVLILTGMTDTDQLMRAVRLGVSAWQPKTIRTERLLQVIHGVLRGEVWIPPDLLSGVLRRLTQGEDEPASHPELLAALTAREQEVLQCLLDGVGRAQIARQLGLSANTVRTHTQNLLAKMEVHSVLEAVGVALRAGLRPKPAGVDASCS